MVVGKLLAEGAPTTAKIIMITNNPKIKLPNIALVCFLPTFFLKRPENKEGFINPTIKPITEQSNNKKTIKAKKEII